MASNEDLVNAAYTAFAQGDIPSVIDALDDKVQWSSPQTLPQGGDYSGREGVMEFFRSVAASWSELHLEIESLGSINENEVVGIVHASGKLHNGAAGEYGAAHVFSITGEKVSSFREYVNIDQPIVA